MLSKISSVGLLGMDGYIVTVEADIGNGMPCFDIVGLPDAAVKEAKERIKAAIKNSGAVLSSRRIVINLAPASIKKEGPSYDLPMAIALLEASSQLTVPEKDTSIFIGELSLDGSIHSVKGVLPMVITGYKEGYRNFYVPEENAAEATVIDGVRVYPIKNLAGLTAHLKGDGRIEPLSGKIDFDLLTEESDFLDFQDVKGHQNVKRAIEIAAAGNHNLLLIGPPGTGKTMLAQRLPSILPKLSFEEALEVTKIHSIAGTLNSKTPIVTKRPFRHPHHTVSAAGLSGGGTIPKPGELSLAHNGVLFLDELPEFKREVLEVMRQPLEDGSVTISRVNATLTYPCNLMLVASMNPCKCGYFGDPNHACTCTPSQINQYHSKISGPLLDRIDIQVEVGSIDYSDLSEKSLSESSAEIKKRVDEARKIQAKRYKSQNIYSNSQLSAGQLEEFCKLSDAENAIMKAAFDNLGLSARAYSRILKVSRTIADLEGSENIKAEHIAEAIQYRSLDRKYFG